MKSNYKYAVIGPHWVHLSDEKINSSPISESLLENVTVIKKRTIAIEGDKVKFDLSFDERTENLEEYEEPIKKTFWGQQYIKSGWARLKKRSHMKHVFYRVTAMVENDDGSVSFRWCS